MFFLVLGLLMIVASLAVAIGAILIPVQRNQGKGHRYLITLGSVIFALIGLVATIASTALFVEQNEAGIVTAKFGESLPTSRVVALDGQKGVRAEVLSPGWTFWYWPWQYDLETQPVIEIGEQSVGVVTALDGDPLPPGKVIAQAWSSAADMIDGKKFLNEGGQRGPQLTVLPPGKHRYNPYLFRIESYPWVTIPTGQVGVVTALDGQALKDGQIFADTWENPNDMINAEIFMKNKGQKGPQLTVLPPGRYPYNPLLFKIEIVDAIEVPIGQAAVIKANAGETYEGETVRVNGVPIVPKGYRGIWNQALEPNIYYMNPQAYTVTFVQTTNRIYAYSREDDVDRSISVRTKDGFEFPVDVRVSVKVSNEDAPYVVAQLGNPDADVDGDGFNQLEERVILPLIRAIFRNSAEDQGALNYVSTRSKIEQQATQNFQEGLTQFRVETDGVFIADIGLSSTDQGRQLLQTQVDREIAIQERNAWNEKKQTEEIRATTVRAEALANQEEQLVASEIGIKIAENDGQAAVRKAEAEATAAKALIEANGGVEALIMRETAKAVVSQWSGNMPQIIVTGGNGSSSGIEALLLKHLQKMNTE